MVDNRFLQISAVLCLSFQQINGAIVRQCSYRGKLYVAGDTIIDEIDTEAKLCTYVICHSLGIVVRHYIWNCKEVSENCDNYLLLLLIKCSVKLNL